MLDEARADSLVRQLRVLEELVKARLEVDVPGMVAGVRARVESRLHLTPLPIDADLANKPGPLDLGQRAHVGVGVARGAQGRAVAHRRCGR